MSGVVSVSETVPAVSHFAGTLLDLLDRVEYRRADLSAPFDPVYRLRYEAYRREDFIPANSERIAGDQFDHSPNAMCFGVYIDGELVSSVRLHHVTPEQRSSPSRLIYGDVLDPLLDQGKSYIDPSRFTADREATLAYPALPFLTLRMAAMASVHFNVDFCLASVRPEHVPFYKRVFMSRQIGGIRYYPGLQFPVVCYAADVPVIRDRVYRRYPFMMSTPEEQRALFDSPEGAVRPFVRPSAREAQAEAEAENEARGEVA
jgi:hypothetical protein